MSWGVGALLANLRMQDFWNASTSTVVTVAKLNKLKWEVALLAVEVLDRMSIPLISPTTHRRTLASSLGPCKSPGSG